MLVAGVQIRQGTHRNKHAYPFVALSHSFHTLYRAASANGGTGVRGVAVLLAGPVVLTGCMGREDAGVVAARMEAQDDASCHNLSQGKGADAYAQCRKNLLYYRQQAQVEEAQRQARINAAADGLAAAGRAMQSIDNPPQNVNVNVTCNYGRC
jgi:hypothetical protein